MKERKNIEGRLDALTSLRFFAAFMVFLWHAQFLHTFELGYAGVGFFYILSGFILTYVYFSKLQHNVMNVAHVKKFYIARIAKLYPVHILTLLIALPLFIPTVQGLFPEHTKISFIETMLANLTLTQSWVPLNSVNFSFNGVAWSISVEMFFYLLFPAVIYLISKFRRFFTIKNTFIVMIVMWTIVAGLLTTQSAVIDQWNLYIFPIMRLPDFIVGVLLGNIFLRLRDGAIAQRIISEIKNWTALELVALIGVAIGVLSGVFMPQSLRFAAWLMPFWAILIFIFSQQKGILSRILQWKPLVFLGEASFSFYMTHQLIIRYFSELGLSKVPTALISLSVALIVSGAVYLYFEEPSRVRLKKFLEGKFIKHREQSPIITDEPIESSLTA